MLDNPVDVKCFLHKMSNKPNIPQKPDFIFACEPDQKLYPFPDVKGLTIKATSADEQKRIALPTKKPQHQAQNLDIVHKKVKKTQKVARELKNIVHSSSHSLFLVYNNNSAGPAIFLSFAI